MRSFRAATMLALALALTACAASRAVPVAELPEPPADFTIDLTILAQPMPQQPRRFDAHLRQSRIVLFADGSLHYGSDDQRGSNWLPGLTRRLDRAQLSHVWSLSQRLGFADPERGEPVFNFDLVEAPRGAVKYLLSITGGDQRWAFVRSSPIEGDQDPAMVELVRALAQLAWVTDAPDPVRSAPIRRYDFGPDPYARYRR